PASHSRVPLASIRRHRATRGTRYRCRCVSAGAASRGCRSEAGTRTCDAFDRPAPGLGADLSTEALTKVEALSACPPEPRGTEASAQAAWRRREVALGTEALAKVADGGLASTAPRFASWTCRAPTPGAQSIS